MSLAILTYREPWSNCIKFMAIQKFHGERPAIARPLVMEKRKPEEDGTPNEPTFELTQERAQELMDQLWTCGLRPSEGAGSAGALAATQKHLEDMRAIALHKLGMDKQKGTK